MKDINNASLRLCQIQADIFLKSVDYLECSSSVFVKKFMYSNIAKRMDMESLLLESNSPYSYLDELNVPKRGITKYPTYVMEWIGYIYRYFVCIEKRPSKEVYKIIKPSELYDLYDAYHSLDPKEAIERIIEAKHIKKENQIDIAKRIYLK